MLPTTLLVMEFGLQCIGEEMALKNYSKLYRSIDALSEWEDNYNTGDVEAIARSIRRFGMNQALRVWGTMVLAGNHTLLALQRIKAQGAIDDLDLAWPPKNVVVKDDQWHVLVVDVSYLDPLEAKAFAIADNATARRAVADDQKLAAYLQELAAMNDTLFRATSYDDGDLSAMLASLNTITTPVIEDEQPRLDQLDGSYCDACGKRLHDGRR